MINHLTLGDARINSETIYSTLFSFASPNSCSAGIYSATTGSSPVEKRKGSALGNEAGAVHLGLN